MEWVAIINIDNPRPPSHTIIVNIIKIKDNMENLKDIIIINKIINIIISK